MDATVKSRRDDLWQYYFSDDIERAAARWTTSQMLKRLYSQSTITVQVLEANVQRGYLRMEVRGKCRDGVCGFEYELYHGCLDSVQARNLLALIRLEYPPKNERNRKLIRCVSKILGLY